LRKEEGQESPAEKSADCVVLKEGRGIGVPEYWKRGRDVLKGVMKNGSRIRGYPGLGNRRAFSIN
jgi:hypothetical protein